MVPAILLTAALLYMPIVALADTLNYSGETPDTGYETAGTDRSDSYWDYVYSISDWSGMDTLRWAIVCPVEPVANWQSALWTYEYYSEADGGIPDLPSLEDVVGQPGIVWNKETGAQDANYFHFQTELRDSPVKQPYDGAASWTDLTEYSASPEPASMVLSALALGAVILRRRRREAA